MFHTSTSPNSPGSLCSPPPSPSDIINRKRSHSKSGGQGQSQTTGTTPSPHDAGPSTKFLRASLSLPQQMALQNAAQHTSHSQSVMLGVNDTWEPSGLRIGENEQILTSCGSPFTGVIIKSCSQDKTRLQPVRPY